MIDVVTLAFLAALPNPFRGIHIFPHHDVREARYGVHGWTLTVRRDRFLDRTTCDIHRGRVSVHHGVVTFQFGGRVDTANAEFRIDQQPPLNAGLVSVEAAGLGAPMLGKDLGNPSAGRVAIPLRLLRGAQAVEIRPVKFHAHRTFSLQGLDAAVDAAQGQGCDIVAQTPPPVTP